MSPKFLSAALAVIALAATVRAQAPARYHTGKLLQMESVQCVAAQGESGSEASACQEYVLEAEGVLFHLHPLNGSPAALLPVGKSMQYRLSEEHFFLRVAGKDREFQVVAMEPRASREAPVHSAQKLNHLQ